MKHLLWSGLAGLFGVLVAFALTGGSGKAYQILTDRWGTFSYQTAAVFRPIISPPPPPVRLTFVGDMMLARGVAQSVKKNGGGDYSWLFANLGDLASADILFGNLEGALSDQGADRHKRFSFRMSPEALPAIKAAGFDVLSVANNHSGDWGRPAFDDTLARLAEAEIVAIGGGINLAEAAAVKVIEKNGQRIGFLAFTDILPVELSAGENRSGILLADNPDFAAIISQAAALVDALVVSFHWGEEYQTRSNPRQQTLSRAAIDAGAKIIIGQHPHVVQEIERYRDGLIAYSLGNFVFDQYFSQATMTGLALTINLERGNIASTSEQAVNLDNYFRPWISATTAN